ncbi:MAG: rhomboid family protein [Paenibacillus sp.]|jgi:rhomboid protease GluP|nr:rhomboid family protein [Paenibacillus sp.]
MIAGNRNEHVRLYRGISPCVTLAEVRYNSRKLRHKSRREEGDMFVRRESLKQYVRLYPVTSALIIIQLLVMAAMEWYGSSKQDITLLRFGAMFDLPGIQPEPWRYVTSIFVHIGFEHLLYNSFALYVFAAPLERMLGAFRYLLFYVACGIAGNLASAWMHSDSYIGAGASGAIYGVYAAYLYLSVFRKDLIDYETKKTVRIIVIIGFVYSFIVPNVDIYAHAGGFVGGLAVAALMTLFVKRRNRGVSREELMTEESTD